MRNNTSTKKPAYQIGQNLITPNGKPIEIIDSRYDNQAQEYEYFYKYRNGNKCKYPIHESLLSAAKFETGATSAAVNELILYTDNTKELAEYRDAIYRKCCLLKPELRPMEFTNLEAVSESNYAREMEERMTLDAEQTLEYCQIYANRFADWKMERELQASQKTKLKNT